MESSLSNDEFVRMQTQLLELRSQNYSLEDQVKRQERELDGMRSQLEILDRDLQKANRAISKSKKMKEVEEILQENDSLQRKLHSQEEEFRLQNETLMHELTSLVSTNEKLEKELSKVKDEQQSHNGNSENMSDEVRRLMAQNAALQKTLNEQQELYKEQLSKYKQTVEDLEAQCFKLAGKRSAPIGEGINERDVDGQSDTETTSEDATDNIDTVNDNKLISTYINTSQMIDESSKQLNDLKLKFDIEKEEKQILKEQLTSLENSTKGQIKQLKEELEKVNDKFKKKQESLVQLQEEKERQYTDLSTKLEDVQKSKEREVQVLMDNCHRLQDELENTNRSFEDHKEKAGRRLRELDHSVHALQSQVDSNTLANQQELQERIEQLEQQRGHLQSQIETLRQQNEDYECQVKESQRANQTTMEQLCDAQRERDSTITALQEANKVAEKRKQLLDELAIKYQQEGEQHRNTLKSQTEQHQQEVEKLTEELHNLQRRLAGLKRVEEESEELRSRLTSLEETKGWLERRLDETQENLDTTKTDYECQIEEKVSEHEKSLTELREQNEEKIKELEKEIEHMKNEKQDLETEIERLRQKIKDSVDEKKLHEKKGITIMKDLKRQLQAERKRAEKLQERFQEVLSDPKHRQSVEELFKPLDENDRYKGDNSSVSSWSTSGLGKDSINGAVSPDSTDTVGSALEQENNDLVSRIADLQQENWMLEEKVSHLEASNAAMAEDLLRKTAIIEHYVMESRSSVSHSTPTSERMTFKRVMDFVKDKGDQSLKEINQKLQHMLEETLTKNMHLQKDLETLSEEVVRLSKLQEKATPRVPVTV